MEAYQQRMVDEKKALDEKLDALGSFIVGSHEFASLAKEDKMLLRAQRDAMRDYSNVLEKRIARFF